jgi:hypothetical protein
MLNSTMLSVSVSVQPLQKYTGQNIYASYRLTNELIF